MEREPERSVMRPFVKAVVGLSALLVATSASASSTQEFASLRSDKVYLREGPTYQHRVLWVYQRKGWPMAVIDSYEGWRRVRDKDGTTGWVSATMLSAARTVVIAAATKVPISANPGFGAKVIALAEPGVVAGLKACKPRFCEVSAGDIDGWVEKNKIWGVGAGEVFQ
jgi:SH3-like domain-containing protein